MTVTQHNLDLPAQAASVDEVLATIELSRRPARTPDYESENKALLKLMSTLAQAPETVLSQIAHSALELTGAGSSGISIEETEGADEVFRWHATAGEFDRYLGGTMPRRFSPCGTVLDRQATLLMRDPVRFYPYMAQLHQPVCEALLVPFSRGDKLVGTVWVVTHTEAKKFDAQDERVVASLAQFASMAAKSLADLKALHVSGTELSAARERLDAALAAGAIGVWTAQLGGECAVDANVREHFGLPQRASGTVTIRELMGAVHPDDLARVLAENKRAGQTGDPYESEFRTVMPDGTVKWVAVRGQSVRPPQAPAVTFSGIVMDITARMTAQIREQEASRRLTEFIATLAHELRNPLAPIRNGLELLRTIPLGEAGGKARAIMGRQVGLMAHLIDDLMDVARISSGKVNLRKERTDLGAAIANAIETSDPQIAEGRHRLSVALPRVPVFVDGDPMRLAQVFSNLLTNASRYTPPGGEIAVNVGDEGGFAVVRVADNGIGIDEDKLAAVFEMFGQVDSSPGRRAGGLGIGLALARSLVALHGGSIHAESAGRGKGCTFVVRLPLAP